MNILMSCDAVGGVWTYALELARALEPYGAGITMAVMGPAPTPAQMRMAAACPNIWLQHAPYKLEWMDEPWRDVDRAADWLANLAVRTSADLIHLNGYSHAAHEWSQPSVVVVHSCALSWWRAVLKEEAPARYDQYRTRVKCGLHAADAVVAPTHAILDAVSELYGAPRRATVIPNGRRELPHPPGEKQPIVLAVGRVWDRMKNIMAIDAVAPQLPWPVYVAGEDRGPRNEATRLNGSHGLGFLNEAELAGWYARASILAHPARYEPFGLAPLEAALSGCALVLGDIPSLREVWGDTALYVDPEDHDALRDAITELAEDSLLRETMADRAHEHALSYSPQRMGAGYLTVYSALLRRNARERVPCAS